MLADILATDIGGYFVRPPLVDLRYPSSLRFLASRRSYSGSLTEDKFPFISGFFFDTSETIIFCAETTGGARQSGCFWNGEAWDPPQFDALAVPWGLLALIFFLKVLAKLALILVPLTLGESKLKMDLYCV